MKSPSERLFEKINENLNLTGSNAITCILAYKRDICKKGCAYKSYYKQLSDFCEWKRLEKNKKYFSKKQPSR